MTISQPRSFSPAAISSAESHPTPSRYLDPWGVVLVLLSALGFSTLGILGKLAYSFHLTPLAALSWRLGGAAIAIWLWIIIRGEGWILRRLAFKALAVGAVVYALQSALFFNALDHATVGMTVVLFFTYPLFAALFSWGLDRQPLGWGRSLALGLALLGCLLTLNFHAANASPVGIGLGLGSGLAYAFYLYLSARLVTQMPPLVAAGYVLLGAATTITLWAGFTHQWQIPASVGAIATAGGLALVATALPILCLFMGLKRLEILPAAILSAIEPLLALVMAILGLGEEVGPNQLLGGLLILASGVGIQTQRK